ncbi:glutaredoxin 3 [uncultured Alphaproteobacteria bacterium]|jgi:glutaredoxin 3|uniref:Glutaredoxin n=1 Tax=uncultured Alphaproteobacteria bacterium TaxID=91750 RepID=A0A212IXD5_9PROT|nr:glutaredoxin 3 [uncultured Alphaproteobacteria bacterium]
MANIEIYTTRICPYCVRAKALLKRKGQSFTEIDVSDDDELMGKMVERSGGRMTVPQIFIDDRHIGGCDDLYELDSAGRLDPLLAS